VLSWERHLSLKEMVRDKEFSLAEIEALHPPLNPNFTLYMLEKFGVTVKLSSPYPARDLGSPE